MGPMRYSLFGWIVGSALWAEVLPPSFAILADGRVTLVCPTPGSVIRYNFVDKDPDRSAGAYLAPVLVPAGVGPFGRALFPLTGPRRVSPSPSPGWGSHLPPAWIDGSSFVPYFFAKCKSNQRTISPR